MSQSKVVAAVEIGTSKVAVLLGRFSEDNKLSIIGHSVCLARGIKKGVIENLPLASDCVHAALQAAESKASTRIDEVYLALTGQHLEGTQNFGNATIRDAKGIVKGVDVDQAISDAKRRELPETRSYIHYIRNHFELDGIPVYNPIERQGSRLEVSYWTVHADTEMIKNYLRIFGGYDIKVRDIVISSVAAASILLEQGEKDLGALVIDIGGGTTDWALFHNGYIIRTGVIAVGGDHITNDLSVGLRTGRTRAEKIKVEHGRAYYKSEDKNEKVWLIGDFTIGDKEFPKGAVTRIIEARVKEIFEIIKSELKREDLLKSSEIASGVVLTGGASKLDGIAKVAEDVLGLEVRSADIEAGFDADLRKPEYTTVIGLLRYALTGDEEESENKETTNLMGGILEWFIGGKEPKYSTSKY